MKLQVVLAMAAMISARGDGSSVITREEEVVEDRRSQDNERRIGEEVTNGRDPLDNDSSYRDSKSSSRRYKSVGKVRRRSNQGVRGERDEEARDENENSLTSRRANRRKVSRESYRGDNDVRKTRAPRGSSKNNSKNSDVDPLLREIEIAEDMLKTLRTQIEEGGQVTDEMEEGLSLVGNALDILTADYGKGKRSWRNSNSPSRKTTLSKRKRE